MRSPSTPWSLMIGLMVVHPVSVFLRHGMISGQWGELVLFEGMGMKFKDKIVLQGCREEYCEYGPATGILCWEYDVTGESYLTRLSGLNEQQSRLLFWRSVIVSQEGRYFKSDIVKPPSKSNRGRGRRPNFVFWVAGSVLFVSRWVVMAWSNALCRAS